MNFYLNQAVPILLCILRGCFGTGEAEQHGCDRDHLVYNT